MGHEYIDFLEVALYLTNPPHHHYPSHPHYMIPLLLNIPLILIILSKCGGKRELAQRQYVGGQRELTKGQQEFSICSGQGELTACGGQRQLAQRQHMRWTGRSRIRSA